MVEARWLDRDAVADHISVPVHEVARLQRRGKLPPPSLHLGPRSPRWWRPDIDAAFGLALPSPQPQGAANLAAAIEEEAGRRARRQAQAGRRDHAGIPLSRLAASRV